VFGGKAATFFNNPIAGSRDPALYQSVRYDLQGYRFTMPNGPCRVTLRFCEPAYKEFVADPTPESEPRFLPVVDFYED
jgi:hypothetical protein